MVLSHQPTRWSRLFFCLCLFFLGGPLFAGSVTSQSSSSHTTHSHRPTKHPLGYSQDQHEHEVQGSPASLLEHLHHRTNRTYSSAGNSTTPTPIPQHASTSPSPALPNKSTVSAETDHKHAWSLPDHQIDHKNSPKRVHNTSDHTAFSQKRSGIQNEHALKSTSKPLTSTSSSPSAPPPSSNSTITTTIVKSPLMQLTSQHKVAAQGKDEEEEEKESDSDSSETESRSEKMRSLKARDDERALELQEEQAENEKQRKERRKEVEEQEQEQLTEEAEEYKESQEKLRHRGMSREEKIEYAKKEVEREEREKEAEEQADELFEEAEEKKKEEEEERKEKEEEWREDEEARKEKEKGEEEESEKSEQDEEDDEDKEGDSDINPAHSLQSSSSSLEKDTEEEDEDKNEEEEEGEAKESKEKEKKAQPEAQDNNHSETQSRNQEREETLKQGQYHQSDDQTAKNEYHLRMAFLIIMGVASLGLAYSLYRKRDVGDVGIRNDEGEYQNVENSYRSFRRNGGREYSDFDDINTSVDYVIANPHAVSRGAVRGGSRNGSRAASGRNSRRRSRANSISSNISNSSRQQDRTTQSKMRTPGGGRGESAEYARAREYNNAGNDDHGRSSDPGDHSGGDNPRYAHRIDKSERKQKHRRKTSADADENDTGSNADVVSGDY